MSEKIYESNGHRFRLGDEIPAGTPGGSGRPYGLEARSNVNYDCGDSPFPGGYFWLIELPSEIAAQKMPPPEASGIEVGDTVRLCTPESNSWIENYIGREYVVAGFRNYEYLDGIRCVVWDMDIQSMCWPVESCQIISKGNKAGAGAASVTQQKPSEPGLTVERPQPSPISEWDRMREFFTDRRKVPEPFKLGSLAAVESGPCLEEELRKVGLPHRHDSEDHNNEKPEWRKREELKKWADGMILQANARIWQRRQGWID